MHIEGAIQFVKRAGNPALLALAHYAVGAANSQSVLTTLAPLQHSDGGWSGTDPDCPADHSMITCTWMALQWLRWINAENHPLVDRTADFLAAAQRDDGSWDEPEAIPAPDLPSWMHPGSRFTRVWLTAAVCRTLLETGRDTKVYFGRALTFLSDAWDDGVLVEAGKPLHPHWMLLPLFKIAGQPEDRYIVDDCMRRLRYAVNNNELDPMDVTAVAHAALATQYVASDLYIAARDKMLGFQQSDGGWATHYGESHRANATVDALMLLRWGGML